MESYFKSGHILWRALLLITRLTNNTLKINIKRETTRYKKTKSTMQIKTNFARLCTGVLFLLVAPNSAYAYSVTNAGGSAATPTQTITTEASKRVSGDSLTFFQEANPAPSGFAAGDTLEISLSGGATFGDANISLEASAGGAGTGDLTWATFSGSPQGRSSLTVTIQQGTTPGSFANFD